MSTLNPILAGSAQSVEAYQQVIEQTSQAVVQWLKQPEMYQGKSVDELRERITLDFNEQGLGNQAAIERAIEYFLKDSLSVHHPQCVAHLAAGQAQPRQPKQCPDRERLRRCTKRAAGGACLLFWSILP